MSTDQPLDPSEFISIDLLEHNYSPRVHHVPLHVPLHVPHVPTPYVICMYRSLSTSILKRLSTYGKVIVLDSVYVTYPIHLFEFDYLVVDLREKEHRVYYQRYINKQRDHYSIILYRYEFQTNNEITVHNEIVDFPTQQVNKEEFDRVLLEPLLTEPPNCIASFFRNLCK